MAAATSILTVNAYPIGVDNTNHQTIVYGKCVLSTGGTYVTGGIPITWSGSPADGGASKFIPPNSTGLPFVAYFYSLSGATGYTYIYNTTVSPPTLRIYNAGTELANAGAITADTIGFEANFARGV